MTQPGEATLLAVLGHPVGHSLSPAMQQAALFAAGIEGLYLAFDVAPERFSAVLDAAATLGFRGLNVTIPHKQSAWAAAGQLLPAAERSGAVNTLVRDGDRWIGDNTDGAGWLDSLKEELGVSPEGLSVALLGAGGAARALADALLGAGCESVVVYNRDPVRAQALCDALSPHHGERRLRNAPLEKLDTRHADLLLNTTPLGMQGQWAGMMPCAPDDVRPHLIVSDIVYRPLNTPLLQAAALCGARVHGGLGMFVHQGARAFERWFGVPAAAGAMRAAVLAELAPDGGLTQG